MSRVTTLLLLTCFNAGLSYGMDCSESQNTLLKIFQSCPGLLDSYDKSYCCYNIQNRQVYCCDSMEFFMNTSWVILTGIIVFSILFSLIMLCVSCLCCSCCPWYRRRHRGVQLPSMVHVIQPPTSQIPPNVANPPYPINATGMSQPPLYSDVVYEKPAPYNPNYVPTMQ
ncbi:hypothetical protein WN48_05524 [Eufriesea mexicana]|uniref:Protein shisa-5 n=1 Tax=Eufriesea mexicana TaxID=516756 RepID=A0A310SH05_9HYME|nr:PREDICTED: protein shisa-4-like isoform X2 [Eufriesea mexicana]OAD61957.1 hypothetical protein WN48_05524 [Eufriesea mexicana]